MKKDWNWFSFISVFSHFICNKYFISQSTRFLSQVLIPYVLHHLIIPYLKSFALSDHSTDLSQEPGGQKAKQHGVIGLAVKPRHADATILPQLALPAVQGPGGEADINQNHIRAAFDEPAAKINLWECEEKSCLSSMEEIIKAICIGNLTFIKIFGSSFNKEFYKNVQFVFFHTSCRCLSVAKSFNYD